MAFIRTVSPEDATGLLREFYEQDMQQDGYVGNTTQAFSLRPEVFAVVQGLFRAIKTNLDARRYELITLVAAARLRCTY
jgi:hypothetical protein